MEENKMEVVSENVIPEVEDVIVVNDGRVNVRIQNTLGEQIGVFRFNPSDVNIVNRYNEIIEKFNDVVKGLNEADIDAEGNGTDDDSITLLNRAEEEMANLLDYMLDGDSKAAFFSKTHMFAPSNGVFFVENVVEGIGAYISRKMDAEVKKINRRVSTHTHGYRTGKHKKGDR